MNEQNKCAEGFDELYLRYNRLVFGVCMSVLHDEEEARDVSQEVFIRLYQWRGRIRDTEKIKSWLCITAKNMSLNTARSRRKYSRAPDEAAEGAGSDPEEKYIEKERLKTIYDAISKLDEKYSQVIIMRYILDLEVREIADITGSAGASVYTRLRRAEKKLEKILREAQL